MSDTPLFQNADEQEALYGSQQSSPERADLDSADSEPRDPADTTNAGAVPVPAASAMGVGVAMGGTGVPGGGAGAIGPALGAAALANETEEEHAGER